MSDLGAPSINIAFKEKGGTLIERGDRGIVLLAVKDSVASPMKNPVVITSAADIPATFSDVTKAQIKLALLGYQVAPLKVLVYGMGITENADVDEAYQLAMKEWENLKFDYIAIPTVSTDGKATEVASWIRSMRTKKHPKLVKAVLPNVNADNEGVINFATERCDYAETVTDKDGNTCRVITEYTCEQYCARIAGLLAGTPLNISATYAPLLELDDCARVEDEDEAINQGKFVLIWDGEKVKVSRAVNSFVTTVEGKGDSYKKIKILDIMDLMVNDIKMTAQDNYLGKYANTYDNKRILISAIREYLECMKRDNLIDANYTIDFDIERLRSYHVSTGKYTQDEIAAMDDLSVKKLNTGSKVFLKAECSVLDAMEDIELPIAI